MITPHFDFVWGVVRRKQLRAWEKGGIESKLKGEKERKLCKILKWSEERGWGTEGDKQKGFGWTNVLIGVRGYNLSWGLGEKDPRIKQRGGSARIP